MLMNLLKETIENIKDSGHKIEDIIFIGSEDSGHCCTWDQFKELADIEYDNGYGGQEIARDLIIVFSDGSRMWRNEYDGSEWWEYLAPFKMPKNNEKIKTLCNDHFWWSLAEMNSIDTTGDNQ